MKKTIAVIGSSELSNTTLVSKMATMNYPLLLADHKWEKVKECILTEYPSASVEVIDCSKECAWQSDIILLYHTDEYKPLLEKIRNVVTGKLIINLVNDLNSLEQQLLLPYSKVVNVSFEYGQGVVEYTISGENQQAVEQAILLLDEIGFKSKRELLEDNLGK